MYGRRPYSRITRFRSAVGAMPWHRVTQTIVKTIVWAPPGWPKQLFGHPQGDPNNCLGTPTADRNRKINIYWTKVFTPFSTIFWYKNRLKPATFMIIIFLFKNGQFQCLFNQLFNRIRLKRYIIRGFDKTNASLTR